MSKYLNALTLLLIVASPPVYADDNTHAGRAATLSGQFSKDFSGSVAHSIAASGQVTLGISAIPLSIGGAVLSSAGNVSAQAANQSMRAANAPIGTPLQISDETVTIMPPNEALKPKPEKKKDQDI